MALIFLTIKKFEFRIEILTNEFFRELDEMDKEQNVHRTQDFK